MCSEAEDTGPENEDAKSTTTRDEIDSLNSFVCSSIGKDEGLHVETEESPVVNTGMNVSHTWTLHLLTRLTYWEGPVEGLANPITIQALTAYIEASKNVDAIPILNRIIE